MRLADPPILERLIFEDPTDLCALVGVVAVVLLALAQRRRSARLALAGAIAVAVAASTYGLAAWVSTGREQIIDATHRLVSAAAPANPDELWGLIDRDAALIGPSGDPWLTAAELVDQLSGVHQRGLIANNEVSEAKAELTGENTGRVLLELRTQLRNAPIGRPIRTRWLLTWRRPARGRPWRVTRVQWLDHPAPDGLKPHRGIWRYSGW